MNLRDLEYIVAVSDCMSFSGAAQQCHVSQPTLSAQIKKLEEELGSAIFERTNKRVMLTDAGQAIIARARRILSEAHDIREAARLASDPLSGKFRIGAFPTLACYFLPRLVEEIVATMPKLHLILVEEKTDALLEQLRQGSIDCAFLALPVSDDFLESRKVFDDPFLLAVNARSPLGERATTSVDEMKGVQLLLLEEGHCLRDQALVFCRSSGAEEHADFRATSLETLRMMVKAGTGVTLMPRVAVNGEDPDIRYIPFAGPAPSRTIGLVWRRTSHCMEIIERILAASRGIGAELT